MHIKSYCRTCGEDHGRGDLTHEARITGNHEPYDCDACFFSAKIDEKVDEIDHLKLLLKEARKHIEDLCEYISNAAPDGSVWTDTLADESDALDCKIREAIK